jgi:hypothetical protein
VKEKAKKQIKRWQSTIFISKTIPFSVTRRQAVIDTKHREEVATGCQSRRMPQGEIAAIKLEENGSSANLQKNQNQHETHFNHVSVHLRWTYQ